MSRPRKNSHFTATKLRAETSDHYYDHITQQLTTEAFRPRALFERYNIEVIATTENPLDDLRHHKAILESGWSGRVITAYRPDPVVDPEFEGFRDNLKALSDLTGEDCFSWTGYLAAHRQRRAFFASMGATSTDHGHPTALTADLSFADAEALFKRVTSGDVSAADAELFRAQMLTEMAGMSIDDGLVMQLHPGVFRNHNDDVFKRFGRDKGADIPLPCEYVHALRPLLSKYGNHPDFTFIVFTLDETSYARELAPLAGHYPAMVYHQQSARACPSILTAIGAWLCHIRGDNGRVDDPMADNLKCAWDGAGTENIVPALSDIGGLMASEWTLSLADEALIKASLV